MRLLIESLTSAQRSLQLLHIIFHLSEYLNDRGRIDTTRPDNGPMALLTLLNASLAFGHVALLDHADFSLEVSERVGLIGRNGTGKSSLLKILAGMERPDDGSLHVQQGVRIA